MAAPQEFELFIPTEEENRQLESLDQAYLAVSEMTVQERQFLNALVLRHKPKKAVELGVSAGSSSVIILNALKDNPKAVLHAIDYVEDYYMDTSKKSGFVVEHYPDLLPQWQLHTGGLAINFLDKVGSDIDFCFIDTAHQNPGEIFDVLMVLPYLAEEAIIAFHDVNLPTFKQKVDYNIQRTLTNNLLMSSIVGHKIVQGDFWWESDPRTHFPNIGAVQINKETGRHIFEIVNLLTLKWGYLPTEEEEKQLLAFFKDHYESYIADYVQRVFAYQRSLPMGDPMPSMRVMTKTSLKRLLGQERVAAIKAKRHR